MGGLTIDRDRSRRLAVMPPRMAMVTRIVDGLQRLPILSVDEARARPEFGGAPRNDGSYAWWVRPGSLEGVPTRPHPSRRWGLLYVGIAPDEPKSGSDIRQRILQHTGAAVGSSTFRFDLAALLFEREGWLPIWTDRPKLTRADLDALGEWQRMNLRVQWFPVARPWRFEAAVIAAMHPPLNRECNKDHPFYETMGGQRAHFRDAARR